MRLWRWLVAHGLDIPKKRSYNVYAKSRHEKEKAVIPNRSEREKSAQTEIRKV
jgi:hypothetical protein